MYYKTLEKSKSLNQKYFYLTQVVLFSMFFLLLLIIFIQ